MCVLKVLLLMFIGKSIDVASKNIVNEWLGFSVFFLIIELILSYLDRLMKSKLENELCIIERKEFFENLYNTDWQLRCKYSNGNLTYISTSQIPELAHETIEIYYVGIRIISTVVTIICSIITLNAVYYIIYFIITPICVYISLKAADICLVTHEQRHKSNSEYMSRLEENIFNMFEIRLLGEKEYFKNQYSSSSTIAIDNEMKHQRSILKYRVIEKMCMCSITIILLLYTIFLIENSNLTIGMLVPILGYGSNLFNCLSETNYIKDMLLDITVIAETLSSFGGAKVCEFKPHNIALRCKALITTSNLSFSYHGMDNKIKFKDITINKGEHIVVSGKSGVGKTTFFRIMLRFCLDYEGDISFGGIPLSCYTQKELLSMFFAYMPQEPFLFNDTIINNITFGDKTKERIVNETLNKVGLNEIIYNSDGTYKFISNGGVNLSGGEKQRISLLRCLCEQKEVYLLDEPTSQLDAITEKKIIEIIKQMCAQKTVILISHNDIVKHNFDREVCITYEN